MNFCKVEKSEVAMLKAMLALLQWCCNRCSKQTEVLFHVGLSNTAPQGDVLLLWVKDAPTLTPGESKRAVTAELRANDSSCWYKLSQYLPPPTLVLRNHQMCQFRKGPENRPFPSSRECRSPGLCRAGSTAVIQTPLFWSTNNWCLLKIEPSETHLPGNPMDLQFHRG